MPRKPKDLDARYTPVASAAKYLEGLAARLREDGCDGELVKIDIHLRFWLPDSAAQPAPRHFESGDDAIVSS